MKTGTFGLLTDEAKGKLSNGTIRVHGTRPVLKIKWDESGNIARYKVRLIVQGYFMQQGVDYDQSFAPCARMATIRVVIALAVHNWWKVLHGDVPNAYLNGTSQKLILVKLPNLWSEMIDTDLGTDGSPVVCIKSLYGAPDAGRNWNSCQHYVFIDEGYKQCKKEPCLYLCHTPSGVSIFCIWVDDNFITGSDSQEIQRMIGVLKNRFNIKILGQLSFALGWASNGRMEVHTWHRLCTLTA